MDWCGKVVTTCDPSWPVLQTLWGLVQEDCDHNPHKRNSGAVSGVYAVGPAGPYFRPPGDWCGKTVTTSDPSWTVLQTLRGLVRNDWNLNIEVQPLPAPRGEGNQNSTQRVGRPES